MAGNINGSSSGATGGVSNITPDDSNAVSRGQARGFIVRVAGDVALSCVDGTTPILPVSANTVYAIQFTHVKAMGTTATGITILY